MYPFEQANVPLAVHVPQVANPWSRALDLKFNPMESSHFENNFKRTINCPTTRENMNEPSKRMTYWGYSGDSRMKKMGGTAANINVSPAW